MNIARPDWQWDEMRQVGTDYEDLREVAAYDERMGRIRDVDAENAEILAMLALPAEADVLEIGCGTGRFARAAAAAGLRANAVDVSQIMLDYVRDKARQDGLGEIRTQRCGFLTMPFAPGSFDAVVSGLALHHLPDLWKQVALRNIARILKPAGQFVLRDVVFTASDGEELDACLERFVHAYPEMAPGPSRHVASEFSTFSWVMEGLLGRAGFSILSTTATSEAMVVYHCRKR